MPTRYLLDTNMASDVIRGTFPRVRQRLVKVPMEQLSVSAVTEAELLFGVTRRPEAARLRIAVGEFLLRVPALPWDSAAAREYAQVRTALERVGTPMGNFDMMIAAHALALQAILVTRDRVFRHLKRLRLPLTLEDWS